MQNRQSSGRRRRGGGGNSNPRPMGMAASGQSANRLEVRVRGNAHQLLEKYKQLARDAHQAGDRVAAEYYLQHSDHYFRVLNDSRIRQEEMRARRGVFDQFEDDAAGDADEAVVEGGEEQARDQSRETSRDGGRDQEGGEQRQRQNRDSRNRDGGERNRDGGERRPRSEQRGENRPEQRYEPRDRAEGEGRGEERSQERDEERRGGQPGDRPRRWQDRRAVRTDAEAEFEVAAEPLVLRMSDGEAALVAFGGVPTRESAPVAEAADATPDEEAPKPRRRGRPRKVEVTSVED